ncbi:MAG: cardiolipin synthase ClsB [Thiomonas arsenitoxydans]|uniref:Cardiolipin synthase B n=1 Tax=Thiomonas arsenitoxydans (strain DSM 22701 / CIP 110005 / 3As) TaxID=426114 RepID=A0A8I1SW18_THIA3|nr:MULTISPECIES: cardiolipin synthase ClsB [Thiomonas]MBN8744143.1 cardiolipin synthase ClsB [Thiomonas arsenitoxydans]ODU98318.1 MAG: cardiolipin synthase B [Thiomonas sp. SCN 64-16]
MPAPSLQADSLPHPLDEPLRWTGGAAPRLLPYGSALFPAMQQAIEQARESIWLQTYIFHTDEAAMTLASALCDAARRGVQVRVLVDGLGSSRSVEALSGLFTEAGVEFMVFRPWRKWLDVVQRGRWRRLHRKLCVVDAHTAFIGGINLIDDRLDIHHGWSAQPRLDYAVQYHGHLARQTQWVMQRLWLRTVLTGSLQRRLRKLPGPGVFDTSPNRRAYWQELLDWGSDMPVADEDGAPLPPSSATAAAPRTPAPRPTPQTLAQSLAALVVRDNFSQRRAIEHSYIRAINRAHNRVLIVSPYFYPGLEFRQALKNAAARGVRVELLLQGRIDYRMAAWAARALYGEMLRAGVHIYEYTPAYLHAKVAVVDADWATVGSSNIDPLSLLVNLEANLAVLDRAFALELGAHIESQIAQSLPINTPDRLRTRAPWWLRPFVAVAARAFVALAGGVKNEY